MNREQFIAQLARLLQDLPPDDPYAGARFGQTPRFAGAAEGRQNGGSASR